MIKINKSWYIQKWKTNQQQKWTHYSYMVIWMNLKNLIVSKETRCKKIHTFPFHKVCKQAKPNCFYLQIHTVALKLDILEAKNNSNKLQNSDYLSLGKRKEVCIGIGKQDFPGCWQCFFFYTGVCFVILKPMHICDLHCSVWRTYLTTKRRALKTSEWCILPPIVIMTYLPEKVLPTQIRRLLWCAETKEPALALGMMAQCASQPSSTPAEPAAWWQWCQAQQL